jgi:hypothetical protein
MGGGTMTGAGATTTGAGATTTGAGTGIPRLIPTLTPAFAVKVPRAAKARIVKVFFIFSVDWTRQMGRPDYKSVHFFEPTEQNTGPGRPKKGSRVQSEAVLTFSPPAAIQTINTG